MKIFIKLMILALVLSYASLFILKKPDGTPIQTLDSLTPSFEFPGLGESVSGTVAAITALFAGSNNEESGSQAETGMQIETQAKRLYRWLDERGVWNYTDTPPPGVEAEILALDAPTVLNLYPVQNTETQTEQTSTETNADTVQTAESPTSLIPERLRQMQETLQNAEAVGSQLQEKLEEQQRILNEL